MKAKYIKNEKGLSIPKQCGTCLNWCRMNVTDEDGKKQELPMCVIKNVEAFAHDGRSCKNYTMSTQFATCGGHPGTIKTKDYLEWLAKRMIKDMVSMPKPSCHFDEVKNQQRLQRYHQQFKEETMHRIYTFNPYQKED